MFRWALPLALLVACTPLQPLAPDLGLADRFEIVAFAVADPPSYDSLARWERPIAVRYEGPDAYREDVETQIRLLGELTGLPASFDSDHPTMTVEISDRDFRWNCLFHVIDETAFIHIWSALPPDHIRHCILEETTQALGLYGDFDVSTTGRPDSLFGNDSMQRLTEYDRALVRILYDPRLHDGMSRIATMFAVRQIVAEMGPVIP